MEFVRKEPYVNTTTEVVRVKIGVKEVDGDYSAQIEKFVDIVEAEQKLLELWTEAELTTLCNDTATAEDWQVKLDADIAAQKNPIVAACFPREGDWPA